MSFRDKDWKQREKRLGDEAEAAYEHDRTSRKIPFDRRGFNRPDFTAKEFGSLPTVVRYEPDYLEVNEGPAYAEVQGLGRDGLFKIKAEKMDALFWWHAYMLPVILVVWNNVVRQIADIAWRNLALHVHAAKKQGQVGVFDPETKPKEYYWVSWADLTDDVEPRPLA